MIDIVRADFSYAADVKKCCDKAFEGYIPIIGKSPAPMYYNYDEEIKNNIVFAALINGKTVGFSLLEDSDYNYMWLDVLAVNPKYSSRGIGKELIAFFRKIYIAVRQK